MEVDCSLPRAICHSCSEDALAAATFRNLCTQSNIHWKDATDYLIQIKEPTVEDKAYYMIYNEATVKDQSGRVPDVKTALKRLNSKSLKKVERRSKMNRLKLDSSCLDCGKKFTSPEFLNYHLRNTLKRACIICGTVMPVKKIVKHLSAEHLINYVACKICHQLFENQEQKLEHEICHTKGNTCKICGNTYINARALQSHHNSHSLFSCKACRKVFENIKCFRHHEKICLNIEPPVLQNFECNECGVSYNRKPSLRIHIIQKHLNVLPYECQTCGKRASTLNHLKSHLKVHKTERKVFECACGAKLRTELGFQLHQRIHTGEKPYECEHCGDKFLSSSRRLDHIKRRHRGTQDFPHACKKCEARFVRPCELKKHYLSVHCSVVDVLPAKREVNPITKRIRNTYAKLV